MNIIEKIVSSGACSGCGLCVSIIEQESKMICNNQGFLVPDTSKCNITNNLEQIIKQSCPGVCSFQNSELKEQPEYFTGHATNPKIRWKASSGGAISAICQYLLDSRQVSYIVEARFNDINPFQSKQILVESTDNVLECCGSRYQPVAMLSELNKLKEVKGKIAFVGKPCEVLALKNYMELKDREWLKNKVLATISFFCAGTPSINASKLLGQELGLNIKEISHIKYRGEGWPGKVTVNDKEGNQASIDYDQAWKKYLGSNVQLRCKYCIDGIGEAADIVMGDSWKCDEKGYPTFIDGEGINLIVARTIFGKQLLRSAILNSYITIMEDNLSYEYIMAKQPNHKNKRLVAIPRLLALKIMNIKYPKFEWRKVGKIAPIPNPLIFIRQFLGTVRRVYLYKKTYKKER